MSTQGKIMPFWVLLKPFGVVFLQKNLSVLPKNVNTSLVHEIFISFKTSNSFSDTGGSKLSPNSS